MNTRKMFTFSVRIIKQFNIAVFKVFFMYEKIYILLIIPCVFKEYDFSFGKMTDNNYYSK